MGDRILATGSDRDIRAQCDRHTRVIDARGGSIMPAFNDAHVHFLMASRSLAELDLYGAETQAEIERRVTDYAASQGGWIVGRGWFYSAFSGGLPTVGAPGSSWSQTGKTAPSEIVRRAHRLGEHFGSGRFRNLKPGVLKEAAMLGVTRHIPARSRDQDLEALRAGMRVAAEHGIGSVQEAGEGQDELELWDALREADELTLRVRLAFDMVPGLDAQPGRSG